MSKYCQNCGNVINDGAKFCDKCGQPVAQQPVMQQPVQPQQPVQQGGYVQMPSNNQMPQANPAGFNSFYGTQTVAPGFSERVNDPEILAAVKKNRKAMGIFGLIIIPLPFIGFTIYSFVNDSMEPAQGMKYGAIVSVIFLLFALFSRLKSRASNTYEGVVVDKKQRERTEHNNDDNTSYYTEYITVVKTTDGKKKKIVERSNGMVIAYNYLPIGARFKYHPQFAFPYELYDKSQAPYIACVACGTHNSIMDDRCSKCNTPLLK